MPLSPIPRKTAMRRLILAAALAAASVSLILSPASAASMASATGERTDNFSNAGVDTLGVDVSSVPATRDAVHKFLSSLAPDARRAVEAACAYDTRQPAGIDSQTIAFCELAMRA
jgi:hypothetical protein